MNTTTLTKLSMNVSNANKLVNYLLNENINLSGTIMLGLLGSLEMYKNIIETRVEDNSIVYIFDTKLVNFYTKNIYIKNIQIYTVNIKEDDFKDFTVKLKNMPKFDFIIQNPPYNKTLHLDFFNKGLDLLSDTGKMIIIEPSTWLIDLRQNIAEKKSSQMKKYIALKERIKGHVSKVIIDNYHNEFNVGLYVPFAITYIDNKKQNNISFNLFGIKSTVKDINDCNKIGSLKLIKSIFNKISDHDNMKNHSSNITVGSDNYYLRYMSIITAHGYNSSPDKVETKFGTFYGTFVTPCCHKHDNDFYYNIIPLTAAKNPSGCVYGTKQELENWKHYVFNNSLPLFINICLTIDQHNNSLPYVPWLVDKQYTDEEIYKMFDFTDEEIKLIETTIKKYKWDSLFYKRQCLGPNSVSDEEVQKFINELENA